MFAVLVQPHLELYSATFHGGENDAPWMDRSDTAPYDWDADDAPWRHLNDMDMSTFAVCFANGLDEFWRAE